MILFEMFLVGGFLFYLFCLMEIVTLLLLIRNELGAWASVSLFLFFMILAFFSNFNIFSWIGNHPRNFILLLFAYAVFGIIWSIAKWSLYCMDKLKLYKELKEGWIADRKYSGKYENWSAGEQKEWEKNLKSLYYSNKYEFPPQVNSHKEEIARWMLYWPVSLILTFCEDLFIRMVRKVVKLLKTFLQNISNRIFKEDFGNN